MSRDQQEITEAFNKLQRVFAIDSFHPPLGRNAQENPYGDWQFFHVSEETPERDRGYPVGSWFEYDVSAMTLPQGINLRDDLRTAFVRAAGDDKINGHQFCPSAQQKYGSHKKQERVLIPEEIVDALAEKGLTIPLEDVLNRHHKTAIERTREMQKHQKKMNEASGWPLWQALYHNPAKPPSMGIPLPNGVNPTTFLAIINKQLCYLNAALGWNIPLGVCTRHDPSRGTSFSLRLKALNDAHLASNVCHLTEQAQQPLREFFHAIILRANPIEVVRMTSTNTAPLETAPKTHPTCQAVLDDQNIPSTMRQRLLECAPALAIPAPVRFPPRVRPHRPN